MQGMSRVMTYDSRSPQLLARVVAAGGLAVIPTDTVYGIVCDPCNDAAIERLFQAKHRPRTKSIQVLLEADRTDPDGIHVLRQGVMGEARVRAILSSQTSGGEGR